MRFVAACHWLIYVSRYESAVGGFKACVQNCLSPDSAPDELRESSPSPVGSPRHVSKKEQTKTFLQKSVDLASADVNALSFMVKQVINKKSPQIVALRPPMC